MSLYTVYGVGTIVLTFVLLKAADLSLYILVFFAVPYFLGSLWYQLRLEQDINKITRYVVSNIFILNTMSPSSPSLSSAVLSTADSLSTSWDSEYCYRQKNKNTCVLCYLARFCFNLLPVTVLCGRGGYNLD